MRANAATYFPFAEERAFPTSRKDQGDQSKPKLTREVHTKNIFKKRKPKINPKTEAKQNNTKQNKKEKRKKSVKYMKDKEKTRYHVPQ